MNHRKTIYVVDDEAVISKTLVTIFNQHGYDASMFLTAEAALDAVVNAPPDLLLTDVILPGMNGVELAQRLAQGFPNVKVIIMSGQAETSILLENARADGFAARVHAKPIHPTKLLALAAEMFSV